MKVFILPETWDVAKFARRYHLDFRQDFYVDGIGQLVVFPLLPDDPPVFEASDPPTAPKPTVEDLIKRIETLESKVK